MTKWDINSWNISNILEGKKSYSLHKHFETENIEIWVCRGSLHTHSNLDTDSVVKLQYPHCPSCKPLSFSEPQLAIQSRSRTHTMALQKTTPCIKGNEHSLVLDVLLRQNQFSSSSVILLLVGNQPLPKQNIKLVQHDPREKHQF